MSSRIMLSARRAGLALALAVAASVAALGCGDEPLNEDPFTSEGFANAVEAVRDDAGEDVELVQVQIKQGRALFKSRRGASESVFVYPGDPADDPISPEAAGTVPRAEPFSLDEVEPDAVDRMLEAIGGEAGEGVEVPTMTLQRGPDRELEWTINALSGNGNRAAFSAHADGSGLVRARP